MLSWKYCRPVSSWVTPRPTVVALMEALARSGEIGSSSSAAHAVSGEHQETQHGETLHRAPA